MSTTHETTHVLPAYDLPADDLTVIADCLTGTVKWFNNKAGYGFITVCDGEYSGKDIFVHFSSIRVSNSQYKYLVQGEYVDFTLVKSENGSHEYQAINVSGVKGGPIMCETRRTLSTTPSQAPRDGARYEQHRRPVVRSDDNVGYTKVVRSDDNVGYNKAVRPVARSDENVGYTKVVRRRPPPRDYQPTVSRGVNSAPPSSRGWEA